MPSTGSSETPYNCPYHFIITIDGPPTRLQLKQPSRQWAPSTYKKAGSVHYLTSSNPCITKMMPYAWVWFNGSMKRTKAQHCLDGTKGGELEIWLLSTAEPLRVASLRLYLMSRGLWFRALGFRAKDSQQEPEVWLWSPIHHMKQASHLWIMEWSARPPRSIAWERGPIEDSLLCWTWLYHVQSWQVVLESILSTIPN